MVPPPDHPQSGSLRPATVAVTAGRPPHEPDQPLNAPITMASTYVAGGDLEYGRYGNPTWTAFEERAGRARGRAVPGVRVRDGGGHHRPRPGRARRQGGGAAALLQRHPGPARRPRAPRPDHHDGRRRHGHRRRGRGVRGRRAGLVRVADQPGARGGRRPRSSPRPATPAPASSSTTRSSPRCCSGRSSWAPTWSCTRRPSTSAATATCRWERSSPRDDALFDVLKGRRDLPGRPPAPFEACLALRGMRTLHLRVERAQANAAELARRLADHPAARRGPLPRARRDRLDRPAHRWPADLLIRVHGAVGAHHLPRRRRVDARAPPPLEVRARHHPRGPGPALGRHRGRRGPLGRPRARRWTAR